MQGSHTDFLSKVSDGADGGRFEVNILSITEELVQQTLIHSIQQNHVSACSAGLSTLCDAYV